MSRTTKDMPPELGLRRMIEKERRRIRLPEGVHLSPGITLSDEGAEGERAHCHRYGWLRRRVLIRWRPHILVDLVRQDRASRGWRPGAETSEWPAPLPFRVVPVPVRR